ncbi:MAG: alanine racemase [Mariprofundaceae bacterium]|nr:alanine racemase [Mariprofundaceae bacterium]
MHRITADIDTDALRYNFRILQQQSGDATVMAVVKANAYGHGLALCVLPLLDEGCRSFAVTDANEGVKLRKLLPATCSPEVDINLLAGIINATDAKLCQTHHLTPAIMHPTQLLLLQEARFDGAVWLKLDTGMNRTGADDIPALHRSCQQSDITVRGLLSHLACADTPKHPLNADQCRRFGQVQQRMPELDASLLNSAGIFSLPHHRYQVVRPGIALYGIEPCEDRTIGLKPVMHLSATIVQTRMLAAGDSVSYGGSFIAKRPMQMAVIAAGYGDGIPRALSDRGTVYIQGTPCPIMGRVCMDYCMVDLGELHIHKGERAIFWDAKHTVSTVASTVDTIAYELLTQISERVRRQTMSIEKKLRHSD